MPSQKVSKKHTVTKKSTLAKKATPAKKVKPTKNVTPAMKPAPKKATPAMKSAAPKKVPAKKAPAMKAPAKKAPAKKVVLAKDGSEKKSIRSFKVQLPGTEEYCGRFTGWTPYQAANKALSRYFRSTDTPKPVVTFSIRESTRGSNHKVYTYEGHRIKLETPVSYTIGGGNTIVKNHKNQLKKVKKADLANKEEL